MRHGVLVSLAALIVGLAVVAGCGKGGVEGPQTVEVSGTVSLDGSPLDKAEISFVGEVHVGKAITDAGGTYELQAEPGQNKVLVRKFNVDLDPEAGFDAEQLEMEAAAAAEAGDASGTRQLIPEKYSNAEKTELAFDVPEGGAASADFELTSE